MPKESKRVVGYARVSSREQSENSHALDQQIARLVNAGATEIFRDVESGSRDDRKEFNRLIELIRVGEIDEVIFTRFDRMSRSVVTIRKTVDVFLNTGCNLRVLDDNLDLSTAAGKFQLNVLASLAEMEVDRLSERIRHGLDYFKQQNKAINPPFAYKVINFKFVLNRDLYRGTQTEILDIAEELIEYFFELRSLRSAVRKMNLKYGKATYKRDYPRTPQGFAEYLRSPVLRGHTVYYERVPSAVRKKQSVRRASKPIIIYNTHPEEILLTEEEYKEIEKIIEEARELRGFGLKTNFEYPLSGLIYCAKCASKYYKSHKWKGKYGDYHYYRCSKSLINTCDNKKGIRMDILQEVLIKEYFSKYAERIISQSIGAAEIKEEIDPELKNLYQARNDMKKLLETNSSMQRFIETLQNIERDIANKEFEINQIVDEEKTIDYIENVEEIKDPNYWVKLEPRECRQLYKFLIRKIIVLDGKIIDVIFNI